MGAWLLQSGKTNKPGVWNKYQEGEGMGEVKHFLKINKLGRNIHFRITQVYLIVLTNPGIIHRNFALF